MDKFKNIAGDVDNKVNKMYNNSQDNKKVSDNKRIVQQKPQTMGGDMFDGIDDGMYGGDMNGFDEFGNMNNFNGIGGMNGMGGLGGIGNMNDYGVGIQPAQKPESFHHFILENKYQDLEKSIRGYKDVYNKTTREWEMKRKDTHCFTDEEAEEILRTAQSLLSTDIKLSFINKEVFGLKAMMLYKRLRQLFREIAEYKYGRYSHDEHGKPKVGGYAREQEMKLQNLKVFVELTERIVANYSRAIQGMENKLTHQSVSAQESLQSTDRLMDKNRRYS